MQAPARAEFRRVKNSERLFQEVAREIERSIVEGVLQPGEMLPPERILGEQFGVSRTVVREALKALELSGLVQVQHGRGAVVLDIAPSTVSDSVRRYMKTRQSPLWALLEVRRTIEVEAAGLAAERATDAELGELRAILDDMVSKVDAPQAYVDADFAFHNALSRASGNPLLPVVLEPFVSLLRESRKLGATARNAPKRSIASHKRILKAIEDRDVDAARAEMSSHFEHVARFLEEGESNQGSVSGKSA